MRFLDLRSKRAIARAMLRMIRIGRAGLSRLDRSHLPRVPRGDRADPGGDRPVLAGGGGECLQPRPRRGRGLLRPAGLPERPSPTGSPPAWGWPASRSRSSTTPSSTCAPGEALSTSALAISWDGRRVTGVVTKDGVLEGAAVIAAVPFERLAKLCSSPWSPRIPGCRSWTRMETSPILGVHLFFDATVMELPHLVLPGRDTRGSSTRASTSRAASTSTR